MINKIKSNIWQFIFKQFGSQVYLIKINKKNILIDTGSYLTKKELEQDLKKLNLKPENIHIVLFTHNHWDHTGGYLLFKKAKFYGSEKDFGINIPDISKFKIKDFKIIPTPGHTKGGISILYKDVLFSGDTLFHRDTIGRTDLLGSSKIDMKKSLARLKKLNYKILCPSHGRK